jgi:hypothetical protein
VIEEIRIDLGLDSDDWTDDVRARVIGRLADAISESALSRVDLTDVRGRLAARGLLPESSLDISFSDKIVLFEKLGLSRSQILEAVQSSDRRQAIEYDTFSSKILLFTKEYARHTVIVSALREGVRLEIEGAVIAFHDVVPISSSVSPLDALKRFVERYGRPFRTVPGGELVKFVDRVEKLWNSMTYGENPTKWFVQDKIAYVGGVPLLFDVEAPERSAVHSVRWLKGGLLNASLIYLIDLPQYQEDLRLHGLRATI